MAHTREKSKGRRSGGRFAGIPHIVMNHPDYVALSANAVRLLLEMAKQYNGHNNGDLSAAWTLMKKRGFKAEPTLSKALHQLLRGNFLVRTREGRFMNPGRQCALYALSWLNIDECPGKDLEIKPTRAPMRSFTAQIIKMPSSKTEAIGLKNCSHEEEKRYES